MELAVVKEVHFAVIPASLMLELWRLLFFRPSLSFIGPFSMTVFERLIISLLQIYQRCARGREMRVLEVIALF